MAKQGTLHKDYRAIEFIATTGEKRSIRSTYPHDVYKADIGPETHPAWTKQANVVNANEQAVSNFQKRFGTMSFIKKS